jgi:hypothetical protein
MAKTQQRLARLEAAVPDDSEHPKMAVYFEMLQEWKGLFEDLDGEISESTRRDCERLSDQIRTGEIEVTMSAFISHVPSQAMDLFAKNAKRIYGDDI